MYEVKVYESFRELLEDWDFSYWRISQEGTLIYEVSLSSFLDQPDITYSYFEVMRDGEVVPAFWCKFKNLEFIFFNPQDVDKFYVVYLDGECYHQAFFTFKEAEEFVRELEGGF